MGLENPPLGRTLYSELQSGDIPPLYTEHYIQNFNGVYKSTLTSPTHLAICLGIAYGWGLGTES